MRTMERRQYEMLARVREFGDTHRALFPESSLGAQALVTLGTAVDHLSAQAISKMGAAGSGKDRKALARGALVEQLMAIGRTARGIAKDTEGFENTFRFPRQPSDQALLTAGHVFARDAETFKSAFLAHGMGNAFIDNLRERIEKFEQAIRAREAGKDGHTAAQAGIEAALETGIAAVKKLDVILANVLRDDPETMAVWERDRRIDQVRRRKRAAAAPASPPPAPGAASVADANDGATP
jgi:hypothetical protein